MWQCNNCGYTDEDGKTFEEEKDTESPETVVRYCPECGSDEVFFVDEETEDAVFDDEAEDEADVGGDDDGSWDDEDEDEDD